MDYGSILSAMPSPRPSPSKLAARTARWATTMTRWAIRFSTTGKRFGTLAVKRWQFVAFPGPAGSESRGIVDMLAIRRDHQEAPEPLLPGDLFEIVLVQIKGGSASWPTPSDLCRLRAVGRRYRARAIVLAAWKKGAEPTFYVLKRSGLDRRKAWREVSASVAFE